MTPQLCGYLIGLALLVIGSVIVLGCVFLADVEGATEDERGQ